MGITQKPVFDQHLEGVMTTVFLHNAHLLEFN